MSRVVSCNLLHTVNGGFEFSNLHMQYREPVTTLSTQLTLRMLGKAKEKKYVCSGYMEVYNREGRLENIFILLKVFIRG